ncbi:voltage-gated hydrogen channel 1 [Brachyhypopomus gauderio]|uniref:voltage-gated hydrogen channel 1 n=1 Tax=Brachyhypopomus gauderio TaxID=698409 RepID=UPI004042E3ED
MARHLRIFTAVGDDHSASHFQWHDAEQHAASDVLDSTAVHISQITFRESMKKLFRSEKFQITVVCLVVLDALFVLCELLMDLSIIHADEHHIAPRVFHYLSLALLTFFMVELIVKLYAFRLEFFKHKFEVFDGIVVVVSFVLDIVYISKEDAFDGMGLLILLRLWRVARIVNGILVTVENRAHHKIQKLEESNEQLVQQVDEMREEKARMEEEMSRLRTLLKQHNVDF